MKTQLIAITLLAALGGISAAYGAQPAAASARADHAAAPAGSAGVATLWRQQLPDAAGRPQSLARFKGQTLVVNFWASWCGPCVQEMPTLAALHKQYASQGVQFIGIGVDSAKNVTQFLQKVQIDYPIYVAGYGGGELARALGNSVGALPFTVIIDRAGTIRYSKLGEISAAEVRRQLALL